MAPAATATRARRAPATAPARQAPRRAPLRAVEPARRRTRRTRRGPLALSLTIAVGSLLSVAGAHAYLTQGQVHLARLQQQLSTAQAQNRDLELRVARLEDPQHVVTQAQQQGLTVPQQVTDLPLVGTGNTAAATAAPTKTASGR
ncbi:MAG: hypothetical protein ACYDA2_09935 [Acidimicrobiales bacterium]